MTDVIAENESLRNQVESVGEMTRSIVVNHGAVDVASVADPDSGFWRILVRIQKTKIKKYCNEINSNIGLVLSR